MKITVKYLASLAEALEKTEDTLTADAPLSVAAIWSQLNPHTTLPSNTVCAVNFAYAKPDTFIDGDAELAFFPPITGG